MQDFLQDAMNLFPQPCVPPGLVLFSMLAQSPEEVDDWARLVGHAHGTLISAPGHFDQGYYGFVFADPDGNRFNAFCM